MPAAPAHQVALGAAAKARRPELGLTQEELHLRSELHQRWISNVETGNRNPSYLSLQRPAPALDLSTSELIARAEAIEAGNSAQANKARALSDSKAAVILLINALLPGLRSSSSKCA